MRLTDALIVELAAYMAQAHTSISQTIRIALESFFTDHTRDRALEIAAVREGVLEGFSLSRKRLNQMFVEIMSEMDRARSGGD